jgi:IS605 OrfB family transposase
VVRLHLGRGGTSSGTQRRWKNAKKLAKAHYRVACQREDTLHKMTTHVAQTYALIGLEDLNAKGMLANHCLAQAVSDASFFEVKRQLLYKVEQHGGHVQLVDRWYASSKTCHHCGWVKDDLTLADRVWIYQQCGAVNERDVNASLNVRDEALRQVSDVPVVASSGHNSLVEREALVFSAESTKLSAMKQVRECCNYVLLHFRKQECIHGQPIFKRLPALSLEGTRFVRYSLHDFIVRNDTVVPGSAC